MPDGNSYTFTIITYDDKVAKGELVVSSSKVPSHRHVSMAKKEIEKTYLRWIKTKRTEDKNLKLVESELEER